MLDVASLSKIAEQKWDAKILTARLCKSDETYFYRLIVRDADGRTQHLKLDAARSE
jgi:uncharacterized membrane protein YkoI